MDRSKLKRVTQGSSRKLKSFHEQQISLYTTSICQNKMNKIKPKTLKREKELLEQLQKFFSLEKADQIQNLDYFAVQIGCYTSDLNSEYFDKVPSPSLSEIQDSEKDSFLSMRDILTY